MPVTKKDPSRLYLEEKETILHASRFEEFALAMTEVSDYNGPNPRRRRIYRPVQLGEKGVEAYGRVQQQIPPR